MGRIVVIHDVTTYGLLYYWDIYVFIDYFYACRDIYVPLYKTDPGSASAKHVLFVILIEGHPANWRSSCVSSHFTSSCLQFHCVVLDYASSYKEVCVTGADSYAKCTATANTVCADAGDNSGQSRCACLDTYIAVDVNGVYKCCE